MWSSIKYYGEIVAGAAAAIFVIVYNINNDWIWFL